MRLKTYAAVSVAALGASLALMSGCSGEPQSDREKCKAAAEDVYRELLKTDNMSEYVRTALKYAGDDGDESLRQILPECKNLTIEEGEQLQDEIENSDLFKRVEKHAEKLAKNSPEGWATS